MTNVPLDFEKVELVREHMELTVKDMCTLLGTTRASYYKWVAGGKIRKQNEAKVKTILRQLLPLLKGGEWPPAGAKNWPSDKRLEALLEILGQEA